MLPFSTTSHDAANSRKFIKLALLILIYGLLINLSVMMMKDFTGASFSWFDITNIASLVNMPYVAGVFLVGLAAFVVLLFAKPRRRTVIYGLHFLVWLPVLVNPFMFLMFVKTFA